MSAVPLLLPCLQACALPPASTPRTSTLTLVEAVTGTPAARPRPLLTELAFYRKYTEAILRRYISMSMEAGRVPSLLGKEIFPGNVTSYQVHSFEDNIIFVHDVESCIKRLHEDQQWLIRRIALQQYTQDEAAKMLRLTRRTIMRKYDDAMNQLTAILLEVKLLEPFSCC